MNNAIPVFRYEVNNVIPLTEAFAQIRVYLDGFEVHYDWSRQQWKYGRPR